MMWFLAAWLLSSPALAQQERQDEPPVIPSAGLATEGGPAAFYVNPSSMAYDADPRWGAYFRLGEADVAAPRAPEVPYAATITAGVGGFGSGIRWLRHDDGRTDVALDLAAAVRLPERVSIGGSLHWNLQGQARNYVSFDASASWRPLPWIGIAAVTRRIGGPGDTTAPPPQTGAGLALRPVGRTLLLGVDYLHTFRVPDSQRSRVALSARVRPTEGLYLRTHLDSRLGFGAGLEMYFGGAGVGVHAATADFAGRPAITAFVGSDEPGENLAPSRRRVTELVLDEAPPYEPEDRLFRRADPSWLDTLEHFDRAEQERGVLGMLVTLDGVSLPWARWQELRDRIGRLESAGKTVVVHLRGEPGNGPLYAASAASRVLAHPASTLALTGPFAELVHVRGLLDAVGADVQVVRRSAYKTAAEPLTHLEPTPEQREQQERRVQQLQDALVDAIAQGRGQTRERVADWVDGGPYTATEAARIGLVDGLAYPDQLAAQLEETHGRSVRRIDLAARPQGRSAWEPPAQIAVVYVEGPIVSGDSSDGLLSGRRTGSGTLVAQLQRAAQDIKVRAVVLRIDSPGGSAYASDEIWRAVSQVQAAGKPVVASFGGVAASGGYYVAAGADRIWAEPTTTTGSIGVLAVKTSVPRLLDWIGVTTHRIAPARNAGLQSPLQRWDALQVARMQAIVDDTYDRFLDRVARGRGLDPDEVEAVAGGRVWSGTDARDRKLVDELGGLVQAIEDARRLAGLSERQPVVAVNLRARRDLAERLLPDLGLLATASLTRPWQTDLAGLPRLGTHGMRWAATWALAASSGESMWMVDPWWMEVHAR